ncbi:MAG TPA: hypothetical protein VNQ90_10885 [Chthoniobacteraceae bacterium]|nr:hypothetical protein [Chthoniobacteraceae bacterium]
MELKTEFPVGTFNASSRRFRCVTPFISLFLPWMRNRLIIWVVIVSGLCVAAFSSARAAVIDFEDAADLDLFNQVTSPTFWSRTGAAGLNGGTGLTGPNSGTPGWVILKTPISATAPGVSGGMYLKLARPTSTSSGYSLLFGISSSATYVPNLGTVDDPDQNHFNAAIHYTKNDDPRRFRVAAQASNGGVLTTNYGEYGNLDDGWYYLSLESTFDAETQLYSISVGLYASSNTGVLASTPVLTATMEDVSLPGLVAAGDAYLFFGIDGRTETRGISALDRFTYQVIPEPSPVTLAIMAGLTALAGCRMGRRTRRL